MSKKKLKDLLKTAKKGELYKEKKLSKKSVYKITVANWEFYIMEHILKLNGMEEIDYLFANEHGTFSEVFRFNKKFRKTSWYDWSLVSEPNSAEFRGKYLTLILFWLLNNSQRVVNRITADVKKKKIDAKRYSMGKIIIRTGVFITNFLSEGEYGESFMDIMDLFTIPYVKDTGKLMETIRTQREFLIYACTHREEYPDEIIWDSIMKMAFLLCTGSSHFENVPKVSYVDFDNIDRDKLKAIVGALGISILIQKSKSNKPCPPLYRAYTIVKPLNYTFFDDVNDHKELRMGVQALYYLEFVISNEDFSKFIKELI